MTETVVVERRRRRPSRMLIELIREKLREIKERHEDIIRLKHEIGMVILDDPDYRSEQESTQRFSHNQRWFVRKLAESLEISVQSLYHCITFARKFPDITSFIMHYNGQLGENFTWYHIVNKTDILYEPRETREEESTEEVRLRRTLIEDIVDAFEDREERNTIIQVVRDSGLTKREDIAKFIDEVQRWRRGETVTTFFGRRVAPDTQFEEAARDIARYIEERRLTITIKGELLDELEETHSSFIALDDVPKNLPEFILNLVRQALEVWKMRMPRTTLQLPSGENNEGAGEG